MATKMAAIKTTAKKPLPSATIEQTVAAFNAESFAAEAAPTKKAKISPETLRAIIGGGSFGVMFAAQMLSSKDPDGEGIDDYFANKLMALAIDMQSYAATGKLPSGFAG